MAAYVRAGARKLPTILGGGILGVAFISLAASTVGLVLPLIGELISAVVGMVLVSRYA